MNGTGNVVRITGAASGLGRAFAIGFAQTGARVVAADIAVAGARETAELVRAAGADGLACAVDVTDIASLDALLQTIAEAFGKIDVLVNNAAIYAGLRRAPFDQIDPAEWDRVLPRLMARELGDRNITVNANAPGFTLTAASLALIPDAAMYGVARGALKGPCEPADIVGAALFLASEHSGYITGQTLVVDGGKQFI